MGSILFVSFFPAVAHCNHIGDAKSVPDLINTLQNEWAPFPTETLENLVESLSRRVETVIAAKGGPIPY